jgi:hypothetical protein
LQSLAIARFNTVYTANGGNSEDIVLEISNENSGPGLADDHWVEWVNAHTGYLELPTGVRLATDACYGHYNQSAVDLEMAAHRRYWDDILTRVDFSPFDVVNLHAYFFWGTNNAGPGGETYIRAFHERIADTLYYLKSQSVLAGKSFALTEFGFIASMLSLDKSGTEGAHLGAIMERVRSLPFESVMIWDANSGTDWSLLDNSGLPKARLAEMYRIRRKAIYLAPDNLVEPITGDPYVVRAEASEEAPSDNFSDPEVVSPDPP